jgi:hypothetical protein
MPHVFDHRPTAQEVFDASCTFFATQSGPAIDRSACRYRAGDRCCAAGYFIPDDKYHPGMDNMSGGNAVWNIVRIYGDVLPGWFGEHERLLARLQGVHDSYDSRRILQKDWNYPNVARGLRDIAESFLLDDKAVEQIDGLDMTGTAPSGWDVVEV